jgi:hypothetical protein
MALPRPGVWRGSLLEAVGVFEGVAGVGFIFFADRYSSSAGPSFSLSEVSCTVSSFRFIPSTREDASLLRTTRIVPVDTGPEHKMSAISAQRKAKSDVENTARNVLDNIICFGELGALTEVDCLARLEREGAWVVRSRSTKRKTSRWGSGWRLGLRNNVWILNT